MPGNESRFNFAISSPTNGWKKFSNVYVYCSSQSPDLIVDACFVASCSWLTTILFTIVFSLLLCLNRGKRACWPDLLLAEHDAASHADAQVDIGVLGNEAL